MENNSRRRIAEETASYWQRHAEMLRTSGISRAEYCRQQGVHYERFNYWISKLSPPTQSNLVPVRVVSAHTEEPVLASVVLKNGQLLRLHRIEALAAILAG